ncbi:non-ribosomal peptide synthetase [Xaviernesmea oryzae]|uniref:non-ribosomal peptide synthetase n=1 Tax=Xaviernesmea oryzae TaxID=464029 RepID=UPI001AECF9C7|nr:non-ribosomal peptide synthetase [Xaviernesmea oryzae]
MISLSKTHQNEIQVSSAHSSKIKHDVGIEAGILPLSEPVDCASDHHVGALRSAVTLSDMQLSYIFSAQTGVELGGIVAAHYQEVDVPDVDISKLERALDLTLRRHPMLRTSLTNFGSQGVIADNVHCKISTEDYRAAPDHIVKRALDQKRADLQAAPPNYTAPSAILVHATQLPNGKTRLHINISLLFIDAASIDVVLRDLWRHYKDNIFDVKEDRRFLDYACYEKSLRSSKQAKDDENFWRTQLDRLPKPAELPIKISPQLISRISFNRESVRIGHDDYSEIVRLADKLKVSPESFVLGLFSEVIRTWSRHQELSLIIAEHGRRAHFDDVQNVVGNFLQPVPLPVRDMKDHRLCDRIGRLHKDLLESRLHGACSTIGIIREVGQRNSPDRGTSTPVVFNNLLDPHFRSRAAGVNLTWDGTTPVYTSSRTPQVWLEAQIVREADEIWMHWNYVDGLFPDGMVQAMAEAFSRLLQNCISDSTIWARLRGVVNLPTQDLEERVRANDTGSEPPSVFLHDMVLAAATRFPSKVAVRSSYSSLTFGELEDQAISLSHELLRRCRIKPNDIVAVSMYPGPELLVSIMSILIAGGAYVAIDPALPSQRRTSLITRCAAKAILTKTEINPDSDLPESCFRINIDDCKSDVSSVDRPMTAVGHDDLAYVIFTSGSTGEPKGVMVSHRNAANTIIDINNKFEVSSDDTVLSIAPPGFDLSVYDYFGVLGAGGCVVFPAAETISDPKSWVDAVVTNNVTIWNSVPAPMKLVADEYSNELRTCHLRLILMSGDWIPVNLPGAIKSALPSARVISLGGATEGSIWSIFYEIDETDPAWSSIPYGKPLANQRFHVLNEWLDPSPKGVTGELYIGGAGVAQGYWADAERTAERFINHPHTGERLYKTGDLGRYIFDGNIEILGREDNQVKINGYRVELGEIEACILSCTGIRHAVIDAPAHPETKRRHIVAYLVFDDNTGEPETLTAHIRSNVRDILPSYMVPSHYVTLPSIPLTQNGKIDRKALPSPFSREVAENSAPANAANATEQLLLEMWREQLNRADLGVSEGFFDAGGDSLHAVGLLSAVRQRFKVTTEGEQSMIEALFMNADIVAFAKIVEQFDRMGGGDE